MKTNFIQALLDYREFLQWNDEDTTNITDQEEAKQAILDWHNGEKGRTR